MNPPSIGGITPASSAPIYRVAVIRADKHGDREPHINKDEVLIFADGHGNRWRMYAKDQPDHYIALTKDSGLDATLDSHNLPRENYGPLSALTAAGGRVDFSTGMSISSE